MKYSGDFRISRRNFLAGSAAVLGSFLPYSSSAGSPDFSPTFIAVQLRGGNDWINTVVPYKNSAYYSTRPDIAHSAAELLPVNESYALPPSVWHLHALYKRGVAAIIPAVGYANPSQSHVRATQIMNSGIIDAVDETGWLGRAIEECNAGRKRDRLLTAAIDSRDDANHPVAHAGGASATICGSNLNEKLMDIARMICNGSPPSIFHATMDGFDTHDQQEPKHTRLLAYLSRSIDNLFGHLRNNGHDRNVIMLVYSEFGRRLHQNDELGTAHGTAGSMLVIGPRVAGGIYGGPLRFDPATDNVEVQYDFRQVYASILEQWLRCDSVSVLGQRFSPLPKLVLA